MKKQLENLITDYQSWVAHGIKLFQNKIGDEYPIRAWRKGMLSQNGFLGEDIEYNFHGIGCVFFFPNCEVDFDYGPNRRYDGFDLWRLRIYWESCKKIMNIQITMKFHHTLNKQ